MKFKDFKREIRKEEINTPDVLSKIDTTYDRPTNNNRSITHLNPNRLKLAVVSVFVLLVMAVVFISNISQRGELIHGKTLGSSTIKKFSSVEELNEKLSYTNKDYSIKRYDFLFSNDKAMFVDETATDTAPNESHELSETNTQYKDVDEADVVKSDGDNIYRVSKGSLLINRIENGTISPTEEITIASESNQKLFDTLIFLKNKYIIVLSTLHEYEKEFEDNPNRYSNFYYFNSYKSYVIVNIYNKESLELEKSFKGPGYLIDSRIIYNSDTDLNTLYFVYIEDIVEKNNQYSLPIEITDGVSKTKDSSEIYYSSDFRNRDYTHFVSIRLDDELRTNSVVQTGPNYYDFVYVNNSSIYLTNRNSKYDTDLYIINAIDTYGFTESLIKYDVNDGEITPVASLIVSGTLLDQFSMDEYNGYLRLALAETNHNKLEIYNVVDNKFKLVGSITEGLGEENETIKSSRFDKDTCLIVTAKNTDPLYKIDLSDPSNPKIIGKFKEDGFNTYLQYLDSDLTGYAFALGYNTKDISEYYNTKTGTKFDLYNIKGDNPVEIDEVNYDVTYIDAVENHKSIFVYKNFIGFEVNKTYHLYEIVNGDEDYKLKEVITYDYNVKAPNEESKFLFTNNFSLFDSRMYYVDGYFYLIYNTKSDNTCNFYDIYLTNIISFNSSFEVINSLN